MTDYILDEQQGHEAWWGLHRAQTWQLQAEDGASFALTCVSPGRSANKAPVIFLPGMFSNRHFWISPKGVGLAGYLAEQGHSCWLVERRGTGQSPRRQPARAGLEEAVQHDLPMVQRAVARVVDRPAYWIGHSFGGVSIALSAARHLDPDLIGGLVLIASQFEVDKPMLRWPGRLFTQGVSRITGRFPARRFGLGPEDEPAAAMDDACRWTTRAQSSLDLQAELAAVNCRVLALAGGADKVDPPAGCERFIRHMSGPHREFRLAARAEGFAVDYDHPGIVVSKSAAREIWPLVGDWLA